MRSHPRNSHRPTLNSRRSSFPRRLLLRRHHTRMCRSMPCRLRQRRRPQAIIQPRLLCRRHRCLIPSLCRCPLLPLSIRSRPPPCHHHHRHRQRRVIRCCVVCTRTNCASTRSLWAPAISAPCFAGSGAARPWPSNASRALVWPLPPPLPPVGSRVAVRVRARARMRLAVRIRVGIRARIRVAVQTPVQTLMAAAITQSIGRRPRPCFARRTRTSR